MSTTVPDVPAEYILGAAEAVYYTRPDFDLGAVATYLRTDNQMAKSALEAAAMLGFVSKPDADNFASNDEYLDYLTHSDPVNRRTIFHMRLERFLPFRRFKERIYCGDSPLEAATRVKSLDDVDNEVVPLKELFQRWGMYATAFTQDRLGTLVVVAGRGLTPAYLSSVRESIQSRDKARTFIQKRLGEAGFNYLPRVTIDSFSSAFARVELKYEPRNEIVFPMGTGFEKFLDKIAGDANPSIDLTGTTGIGTMLNTLRQADVITGKQRGLAESIVALRNASDHGVDNEIKASWNLSYETILDVGLVSLDTMRSMIEWTQNNRPLL